MSNGCNLLRSRRPRSVLFLIPGLKISIIVVLVGSLLFSLMLWHYLNIQDQWEFKPNQKILELYIGLKIKKHKKSLSNSNYIVIKADERQRWFENQNIKCEQFIYIYLLQ